MANGVIKKTAEVKSMTMTISTDGDGNCVLAEKPIGILLIVPNETCYAYFVPFYYAAKTMARGFRFSTNNYSLATNQRINATVYYVDLP